MYFLIFGLNAKRQNHLYRSHFSTRQRPTNLIASHLKIDVAY